jgi:hypothetical protein
MKGGVSVLVADFLNPFFWILTSEFCFSSRQREPRLHEGKRETTS